MITIITGGQKPPFSLIEDIISNSNATVSADSGFDYLYKHGIIPNYSIGDFDSVRYRKEMFENVKTIISHPKDKDLTDTALALDFCFHEFKSHIVLIGGSGSRMDHFLSNLHYIASCKIPLLWITKHQIIQVFTSSFEIKTTTGETISLINPTLDAKITSSVGLKWSVANLDFTKTQSVSNECTSSKVSVSLDNYSAIFVMRKLKKEIDYHSLLQIKKIE